MNDSNYYSSDSLYTSQNKSIVVIDSRNSTYNNNASMNSDISFVFEEPIQIAKNALKMTCSVLSFTASNSIYNINSTNNYLHMFYGSASTEVKVCIPYGNYNSSTFMVQFVASTLAANSTLGTGLSITLNAVTNRFTISHTSYSILFYNDSTISPVIGLPSVALGYSGLGSSNQLLSYTCNFTGIQNINIHIDSMNTDNIDSLTKSTTNIVQSVAVDSNQSQIIFKKSDNFEFMVKEDVTSILNITLNDDLGQLIDFNNQHWNMTLCFTTYIDIERFSHNFSFKHILRNGYSV
jgi:hypothetical protein